MTDDTLRRFRANRQDEVDSAAQYHAMAAAEPDTGVARIYRELAAVEDKHAGFWEAKLRELGVDPGPRRPSWRARVLAWAARWLGPRVILPTVARREAVSRNDYAAQSETVHTQMPAQERSHARVLQAMLKRAEGVPGNELARVEGRHRTVGGNALRAAVLGANDGLCSNLALVMGVAGASTNSHAILVAGLAGLVAGACSMALGEWVSVTSSRELAEREIRVEREELAAAPEEEREELQLIYEAKGVPKDEAQQLSQRLLDDRGAALDVLAREELGLDPEELGGSARIAAITSFLLFAFGAVFPVIPYMIATGTTAFIASIATSGLTLFAIGAAITLFTGRSVWISGGRQTILGLAAAGLTFGLGSLLGTSLG
ncbi:MAG TPA: VIT1/CCC1 transporter family protein [Kofleriaceae bacterium]|nr:VIT1/CCC1 transporter family protein [Kofleriaceae bacterium]